MHLSAPLLVVIAAAFAGVEAAPLTSSDLRSKAAQGLRLLELSDNPDPIWKTEDEKLDLMRKGIRFFDVTDTYELSKSIPTSRLKVAPVSYGEPSHQDAVKGIIGSLSVSNMQGNLEKLTGFNNRYYKSSTGAEASKWILETVQGIASGKEDIKASAFKHDWEQTSTIVRIAGKDDSGPITILGAHMDSIDHGNPMEGKAPGADDDGSGTVNLIEAFRALVSSGFKPSTPVEFHWYSGEEGGLLGSNAIATKYRADGVQVKGFMQLDMTAYFKPGDEEVIALMQDYTDSGLNEFLEKLGSTYTKLKVFKDKCGYGCSDHASWDKNGFPASMPFEAPMGKDNPVIHSPEDTTKAEGFNWDHSLEFTKLAVAYAYEMAA